MRDAAEYFVPEKFVTNLLTGWNLLFFRNSHSFHGESVGHFLVEAGNLIAH
jgi:hypothetical protein